MQIIETERLIIRHFKESDLEDFYNNSKSLNVGPNAGWKPHESKEESQQILSSFIENEEVWAIEAKENHRMIGSLGLHKDYLRSSEDIKMLGYVLAEDYWGRGFMTEAAKAVIDFAFQNLNISLLSIHHYTFNQRSKRIIEKCGFCYEGTLRHAAKIYNGNVYDLACYSMTRDEWLSLKLS